MRILLITLLCTFHLCLLAQQPVVYLMNSKRLIDLKKKFQTGDEATRLVVNDLRGKANNALSMKPLSVMNKAFTPVSGDKHDYMSQAPYFWFDSSKANGLPYMRRDGEHNPEIKKITDHDNLSTLDNSVRLLSLAWYFTGDEKYALKAATLIRYWFINADTRMNPNLQYAQGIPGITSGRGIGLIETRSLIGIADAAGLLSSSSSWTEQDSKSLKAWYKEFLDWMLTSKNGKEEHAAKNNHGSWYYAQAIDYALFTGQPVLAVELINQSKSRLDSQITKEGKWPLELERTNALGYSTMNTQAWFTVATLADHVNMDLWHFTSTKSSGLKTAVDWLLPYATNEMKWNYQQIGKYNANEYYVVLLQAYNKYNDPKYLGKINSIKPSTSDPMVELLYH
jgi:hypothetical protein